MRIHLDQFADWCGVWSWCAGGAGVDFTGCTAELAFRVSPDDPAPLFALSTTPSASGSIVLGTPEGELGAGLVQVNVARAATSTLTAPVIHGDLLITMSDGTVTAFAAIDADVALGSTY